MNYEGIEDVSIYVGPACNFNCQYCDRAYVKSVGVDSAKCDPELIDFVVRAVEGSEKTMVSFHGGETLVYVKVVNKIIDEILERIPNFKEKSLFYIQTNGSLILKNQDFFVKYRDLLYVSISYDFLFQKENRTEFDIDSTLAFLNENNIPVHLQYVIPTYRKDVFSANVYAEIVRLYKTYNLKQLVLILLRHIRHEDRFETVIADESINLKSFFMGFMQFVQLLYVSGIKMAIDGHATKIDKKYFKNHKQMVLAPNGMIVPEYQFIEYNDYDFAIGRWKPYAELTREEMPQRAADKIRKECRACPATELCGLRYHYAMFDMDPPTPHRCREFYLLNTMVIKHLYKLTEKPTLLHHLGVQE